MDGREPYPDPVRDRPPKIPVSDDRFAHEKLLQALEGGPVDLDELVRRFPFGEKATVRILDGQKEKGMLTNYEEKGKIYYRLTEKGEYKVKLMRGGTPIILKRLIS